MERPSDPAILVITFFYYHDLARAQAFYEDVMGFTLAIDQGWSKIMAIGGGAHVGLVDEARGMHRASKDKPVQLCVRVADVDGWYAYARHKDLENLSDLFENQALGIRAFVFEDPKGYQTEIQSATREGA